MECLPGTVFPIDERALARTLRSLNLSLDPEYQEMLPRIHGGVPTHAYFDVAGDVRRVGWFTNFLNSESPVPAGRTETETIDRSLAEIVTDLNPFFDCEVTWPFCVLYDANGVLRDTARFETHITYPADALCFDNRTTPHSVVLSPASDSVSEMLDIENSSEWREPGYSFLIPVASSFREFVDSLRKLP